MIGQLKGEKLFLSSVMDEIEAIEDVRPKTTQDIELKSQSNTKLAGQLYEGKLKW
jgi:hypothetical protein